MAIQHFIASSSRPTPIFYLLPTLITFFKSMSFPPSLVVISFPFIIFTFWWLFDDSEMTSSRLKPWNQTKQYFWGLVLNVFLYAISPPQLKLVQISSWFSWSCQESGSSDLCFCFFMLVCTSHRWRYLSVGNSKAWSRYCLYSGEVKLIILWLTTCVLSSNSSCHKTLKLNFPINRQNMTHWTPLNYHTFFFWCWSS